MTGPGHVGANEPACDPRLAKCVDTVLVWPAHAAQVAFWLLVLAALVLTAWFFLRGAHCWRCGRETGLCQHTRYDTTE